MPTRRLPALFASARSALAGRRRAPEMGRAQTGRRTATRDEPMRCLEYVRLRDGSGQRGAATTGSGTETE